MEVNKSEKFSNKIAFYENKISATVTSVFCLIILQILNLVFGIMLGAYGYGNSAFQAYLFGWGVSLFLAISWIFLSSTKRSGFELSTKDLQLVNYNFLFKKQVKVFGISELDKILKFRLKPGLNGSGATEYKIGVILKDGGQHVLPGSLRYSIPKLDKILDAIHSFKVNHDLPFYVERENFDKQFAINSDFGESMKQALWVTALIVIYLLIPVFFGVLG